MFASSGIRADSSADPVTALYKVVRKTYELSYVQKKKKKKKMTTTNNKKRRRRKTSTNVITAKSKPGWTYPHEQILRWLVSYGQQALVFKEKPIVCIIVYLSNLAMLEANVGEFDESR